VTEAFTHPTLARGDWRFREVHEANPPPGRYSNASCRILRRDVPVLGVDLRASTCRSASRLSRRRHYVIADRSENRACCRQRHTEAIENGYAIGVVTIRTSAECRSHRGDARVVVGHCRHGVPVPARAVIGIAAGLQVEDLTWYAPARPQPGWVEVTAIGEAGVVRGRVTWPRLVGSEPRRARRPGAGCSTHVRQLPAQRGCARHTLNTSLAPPASYIRKPDSPDLDKPSRLVYVAPKGTMRRQIVLAAVSSFVVLACRNLPRPGCRRQYYGFGDVIRPDLDDAHRVARP